MKEGFRQCMAWVHTWTGLVVGWVLFFVFATGTAGYVDDEITRWMQPELPLVAALNDGAAQDALVSQALARLQTVAPQAKSWTITLPHESLTPRGPRGLSVAWEELPVDGQESGRRGSENLDPATGQFREEVEARDTGGGFALYRMHYALHYVPYLVAIKLVGVCTMLMLLAVITGVITHKKIFTDFFTFRPGKGQRSWLDAHNVISVMTLPFFLMITYTGLIFFTYDYMPAGRDVLYGTAPHDRKVFFDELLQRDPDWRLAKHHAVQVPKAPVFELMAQARAQWGSGRLAQIHLTSPEGEPPRLELRKAAGGSVNMSGTRIPALRFDATDGTPLPPPDIGHAAVRAQQVLVGLHEGLFADWWLRWLYFIAGLLGCAVIATGLVLWTVKRRTQHQKARDGGGGSRFDAYGLRLVEVLNAGTVVGLPIAMAAYFWANRLLPLGLADRAEWELHTLFLVWGWTLLYASVRPIRKAWFELLVMAVVAYACVPLLNALTTDRHLGVTLPLGDWGLAGFDLTMFALSALFACMAVKLRRRWSAPASRPQAAVSRARDGWATR